MKEKNYGNEKSNVKNDENNRNIDLMGLVYKFDLILKYKVLVKALLMYVVTSVVCELVINSLIQLLGYGKYFYFPHLSQPEIIFPRIPENL